MRTAIALLLLAGALLTDVASAQISPTGEVAPAESNAGLADLLTEPTFRPVRQPLVVHPANVPVTAWPANPPEPAWPGSDRANTGRNFGTATVPISHPVRRPGADITITAAPTTPGLQPRHVPTDATQVPPAFATATLNTTPAPLGSPDVQPAASWVPGGPPPVSEVAWPEEVCTPEPWVGMGHPQNTLFADGLFIAQRNSDVAYATIVNGAGAPAGAASSSAPETLTGFRVGGHLALTDSESLRVTFWSLDSSERSTANAAGALRVGNLLGIAPLPLFAADSLAATADRTSDLSIIDVVYRRRVTPLTQNFTLSYRIGARLVEWDDELTANYAIGGPVRIDSDLNFSGAGLRAVIEAERWVRPHFMSYFDVGFSLLGGTVDGRFRQTTPGGAADALFILSEDRFVPVLEGEFGVGWQSTGGMLRVKAGYHVSGWLNMLTQQAFVQGLQAGNIGGAGDTVVLDGFTTRVEVRF